MATVGMGEESSGPIPVVVLKVDINCRCDGCLDKIRNGMNSIKDFEGVERIWKDYNSGMITVFGSMDPQILCNKLQSKTKKSVKIVFLPTGNPSQGGSITPPSDHGDSSPSAPPISEMLNSTACINTPIYKELLLLRENRIRDAEKIKKLEEELEQCRRLIEGKK